MFGFLVVDKPAGRTSREVVNRVQRQFAGVKAGHAGTLDPLATGVLVIGLGPATRLVPYVQRMPKKYVAHFLLGVTSPTDDVEGEVTEFERPVCPTRDDLLGVVPSFTGWIEQVPPAYSALKIRGQRAYKRARRGEQFDVPARRVRIDQLTIDSYEYPHLCLKITCSSGTYIRSLGRDIAKALGSCAVMSALRRESIGPYHVSDAIDLERSTTSSDWPVKPPLSALEDLPRVELCEDEVEAIRQGRRIEAPNGIEECGELVAVSGEGKLVALLKVRSQHELAPYRVFPSAEP